MKRILDVHIGEVKVAKQGETLKAILGSCVGIGLIWRERQICGLAHCLLPESPKKSFAIDGRFVDQALKSLLVLMRIRPENYSSIEVVLAGGGNMTVADATIAGELIGERNTSVALREIKGLGLKIIHQEIGGEVGRRIILDASDCSYRIEEIPRLAGTA
ncbi:MAG: chemotaxis protein CheD [Bdellovibrionales bacterium]|jgi:chemotaxis protein CheD|nr:chemotaxis protein CheD [Bdellovibrionales bacterium]